MTKEDAIKKIAEILKKDLGPATADEVAEDYAGSIYKNKHKIIKLLAIESDKGEKPVTKKSFTEEVLRLAH